MTTCFLSILFLFVDKMLMRECLINHRGCHVRIRSSSEALLCSWLQQCPSDCTIIDDGRIDCQLLLVVPGSAGHSHDHRQLTLMCGFWDEYHHVNQESQLISMDDDAWQGSLFSYCIGWEDWHLWLSSQDGEQSKLQLLRRITGYIYKLRRNRLISSGALLMHASAIAYQGHGFLFVGKSGAGKSTTARMAASRGAQVFHDDRVLLYRDASNDYYISQESSLTRVDWLESSHLSGDLQAPLRAIFLLQQYASDHLHVLSAIDRSYALMNSMLDAQGPMLHHHAQWQQACHSVMQLSTSVPVFQLQLRKGTGFLRLLKERFID